MLGNFSKPGVLFYANPARRHWVLILSHVKWKSNNILHASERILKIKRMRCVKYNSLLRHLTFTVSLDFSINLESPRYD